MDAVVTVKHVEEVETRSGKTRYVLRDEAGNEYTTFRPRIGQAATAFEGRGVDEHAYEVAWKATIDAAPWLLGTDHPDREVPPDELFEKLQPFKEMVAEDIESGDDEDE